MGGMLEELFKRVHAARSRSTIVLATQEGRVIARIRAALEKPVAKNGLLPDPLCDLCAIFGVDERLGPAKEHVPVRLDAVTHGLGGVLDIRSRCRFLHV